MLYTYRLISISKVGTKDFMQNLLDILILVIPSISQFPHWLSVFSILMGYWFKIKLICLFDNDRNQAFISISTIKEFTLWLRKMSNFSSLCYAKKVLLLYMIEFPKLCIHRHCIIGSNETGSNAIVSNDTGLKDNKTTYGKQHRGKKCEKRVISFYEWDITLFYIK